MKHIALITPDRGDRPEFTAQCIKLMQCQSIKADAHFVINYPALSDKPDLTQRVRKGIQRAKDEGYKYVMIIENDDYYPQHYIRKFINYNRANGGDCDFIGIPTTIYYHISGQYTQMHHPNRSSLFCTAIKIDALHDFTWPDDDFIFLDLLLWQFAQTKKTCLFIPYVLPIGIKHGIGKCGGNGHNKKLPYYMPDDENNSFLLSKIDNEHISFYKQLTQK